jgi:23S rRNA (adenine2030-N6)-methyltransferase
MNYRHAFHAGNFADVHKHAVLVRILTHLRLKPSAFRIIDTHAGAGRYDLLGAEATRGGEWHNGIERIWDVQKGRPPDDLLGPYLAVIGAFNPDGKLRVYPGSPLIAANRLRPQDRLIACEIEPRSATALVAALRGARGAKVLTIDGWMALGANVPPKERRGLVLVDPPYEDAVDFTRLSAALSAAYRKWPTGIYMLWYPIKERGAADALARALRRLDLPNVLRCELMLAPARGAVGLTGSGLIVVNPPFRLDHELHSFMPSLCRILSPAAVCKVDWLAEEASLARP